MSKFDVGTRVRGIGEFEGRSIDGLVGTVTVVINRRIVEVEWPHGFKGYGLRRRNWSVDIEQLEPITEGGDQVKRRTFKLTKELPELAKGALVQEKCDDGDQDYTVLDQSFIKYEDEHGRKTVTYPRKAVEDEPSYFVEVFAVEPAYMTQDELDRFEAFKVSVKKPRNVIAQVADGMTSKPVLTKLAMKSLLKGTPASKPRSFTLGEARLDQFVKAWNSSRSVEAVQRKLNISRSTVTVYRSFALRQGRILKTMKRPNTKVA